jgi:hypothetical protein
MANNPLASQISSLNTTNQALSSNQPATSVVVQNDPNSTVNIGVGDTNHQYIQLKPSQSVSLPCSNLNTIFVVAASNATNTNVNIISYQQ